jgi:hypothetical protein
VAESEEGGGGVVEYTIEITQFCENGCIYCSSNATEEGQHLPFGIIIGFLESRNITVDDRINISGGEPLAHPQFYHVLKACLSKTNNVWVYTNALQQIKYNAQVLTQGIRVEANYCLYPGCFERPTKIPDGTKINLLKFIPQGRGADLKDPYISVSGNLRGGCAGCNHVLLQADARVVKSPCCKEYDRKEADHE